MYQNSGDTTTNSFYPHQFHQPPNPNPIVDPYANQWPQSSASAPPLSSSYAPPSDYLSFPPPYPSQTSDHVHNSAPTAPPPFSSNPNPQFPPSSSYPYDHNQPPYYSYDHNQPAPNSNLNPNPSFSGPQYLSPPSYDDSGVKYDHQGGFGEQEQGVYSSQGYSDDGVYRYEGGKVEPYGARGTAGFSGSSSQAMFDDYGRPINVSNGNDSGKTSGSYQGGTKAGPKMVRAIPKEDAEEDAKGGVQKFRVKVLSEGYGQNDLDVICQVGLDGIRMLDPATGRTLRIYPFETVTRWEVLDSYIFAFWAKMPVDIEPKRIRIKSNSYTTNTILDTVTAASVQLKEIGERKDSSLSKTSEQLAERKKGFDWKNLIKPANEEKDYWVPDEAVNKCTSCATNFNAFNRKHHCRNCGEIFCDKCTQGRTPLTADEQAAPVRVCDRCMAEVTQRLTNSKEAANRSGSMLSHEDLAKKLKEEMSRNSKSSAGSKSEGSQTRMRDVACPTCTVHLQVKVPASGSETIECSVCQHPFLVNSQ
ncbi:hypothetical protein SOVF_164460 [Spinacia oleracea]|uniref:Protein FREE1 n=1 Tax=Spinacia oleracea TaxID=3562 RepID=A0A9R0IM41_SPIOL|nr:protein FREE1-like [Spinacia oleracea]KNA08229.1 hypothetical protein SOVF_164460 [Spinacia oleracea]